MPISDFLKGLREKVGHDLLFVPAVAAVVRDEHHRVLFQRRSDNGLWTLPSGTIDPGESPATAIVREVYEETGLEVRPTHILGVYGGDRRGFRVTYPNGDHLESVVIVFAVEVLGGTLGGLDGESLELRYIDPTRRPELMSNYPDEVFIGGDPAPAHFDR
ncbi:NUDIX hydrolase [Lujinxingia litoralis]|uniref:NUDIX hydrolase n=1 Tax=Lujinxingia litoralis TaxID=2211119 RepID=A0A328C6A7_9DELT|nr:NUDIX domain-containing protein [Lujinxingia litoralis]RAL21663.1 NUDIX hydrolase [Lujinxingia litoralis]